MNWLMSDKCRICRINVRYVLLMSDIFQRIIIKTNMDFKREKITKKV